MPLRCPPPGPAQLMDLPHRRIRGQTLWRVFQRRRGQPWFFASADPDEPLASGRFDLFAPLGSRCLATSKTAAVLEALQGYGEGVLPNGALRQRAAARVHAPPSAPTVVRLTAAVTRGVGVTAALWAGEDRACTQAWAGNLHRAGWRGTYQGVAHDPVGRLRAVTLFDQAGAHLPYDDDAWSWSLEPVDDDHVRAELARYGITVTRDDPELAFVPLSETDLLEEGDA